MNQTKQISPTKFIFKQLGRYKTKFAIAIFWSILFVIIPMQIPILAGGLIDGIHGKPVKIYQFINLSTSTSEQIVTYMAIGLIVVGVFYGITAYLRVNSLAVVTRRFVSELRRSLVQKLEILSLDVHVKYGSGELLNRTVLDTETMRPFIENSIVKTIINVVRMVYPLLVMVTLDPFLTGLAASVLPIQWLITRKLQNKVHEASRNARKAQATMSTVLKENLDGIETIHALNAQKRSIEQISKPIQKVELDQIQSQKYAGLISGFVWALTGIGIALVWWQGGLQVLEGRTTIGTLVAITGLVVFIYEPSRYFTQVVNAQQNAIVAAEHMQEIFDSEPSIKERIDAEDLKVNYGKIEFRNVSFSYSQQQVLTSINSTIRPYTITGIVGRSGSGKSSLLKLITRLYDSSEGQILIDDQDIKQVTLESLRSQIAVVPQSPLIFSGTVSENVLIAKPEATEKEIEEACEAADALKFISELEHGFETQLGQGGSVSLSVGQVQRIAIARALIRKPKILLLDEPSSALDHESENAIMNTLYQLKRNMTIILVGHNLKSISNKADKLIVIDKGHLVEEGTPRELLVSDGPYSLLYNQNLTTDE